MSINQQQPSKALPAALAVAALAVGAGMVASNWLPGMNPAPAPVAAVAVVQTAAATYPYPLGVIADPVQTPGVTNPAVTPATISTTIAVPGWTATVRPPVSYTDKIKRDEIASHYPAPTYDEHALELDHRVPLTCGGNPTDRRNLWIEPWHVQYQNSDLGAKSKDVLEVHVSRLIVGGKMSLADGQAVFTGDWPAAYLRLIGPWPKWKGNTP